MSENAEWNKNTSNPDGNQSSAHACVLVNLGTPAGLDKASVRAFLAEFLADPRVVNLPRVLWLTILYGLILPFRTGKTLEIYRQVWMPEGSPLRYYSERLCKNVATKLPAVRAELAMRYGEPSINSVLTGLAAEGIDEITILPLYPQFSSTTSASVFDAVADSYRHKYNMPTLHLIRDYYQHPAWQQAIADSITAWQQQHGRAERLIFSFHGLPQLLDKRGDPYRQQCEASTVAIATRANLNPADYQLCYQSRFGKASWLQPYLEPELQKLAASGLGKVQVVCPGFAVDGIETLEEIAIRARKTFIAAGGESLEYIPALNDSDQHARVLVDILTSSGQQCSG